MKIVQGYQARSRNMWSAIRWQTYQLMRTQAGDKEMRKNRIFNPQDLLKFPWDDPKAEQPLSDSDREELQELMATENKNKNLKQ